MIFLVPLEILLMNQCEESCLCKSKCPACKNLYGREEHILRAQVGIVSDVPTAPGIGLVSIGLHEAKQHVKLAHARFFLLGPLKTVSVSSQKKKKITVSV